MTLLPILLPEGYVLKVSANDQLTVGKLLLKKNPPEMKNYSHYNSS